MHYFTAVSLFQSYSLSSPSFSSHSLFSPFIISWSSSFITAPSSKDLEKEVLNFYCY